MQVWGPRAPLSLHTNNYGTFFIIVLEEQHGDVGYLKNFNIETETEFLEVSLLETQVAKQFIPVINSYRMTPVFAVTFEESPRKTFSIERAADPEYSVG